MLIERACECIVAFRAVDFYFKETFCKMSQGLASNRAYREAESSRQAFDQEFVDICEWAKLLKPGWETTIIQQCSKQVDEQTRKQMNQQQQMDQNAASDQQTRHRERMQAKLLASEKRRAASKVSEPLEDMPNLEELAKAAEEELLGEEEQKDNAKKKNSKKSAT